MNLYRFTPAFFVTVATALSPLSVHGAFHLWYIKEIYSNHDGSVQFIELFTTSSGQQFLAGHTLESNENTFIFTNSPAPTNNRHLLLATAGFGSIAGGATPNYTIPANFFNPASDSLNFAAGFDVKAISSAPTDGVMSLNYTGSFSTSTIAANSPRNYAGAGGSVNLPPPASPTGDYNSNLVVDAADYIIWRDTLTQSVTAGAGADGNANGTIDGGDYDYWRARFGKNIPGLARAIAAPEPATLAMVMFAFVLSFIIRNRRPSIADREHCSLRGFLLTRGHLGG